MAKKKATQKTNDANEANPQEQKNNQNLTQGKTVALTHRNSMEDPSEQIKRLKSLNDLLVHRSHEQRQQVESLSQAKAALEAELSLFGVEKSELLAELSGESDQKVSLEIEKGLFCVFLMTQMKEMGEGLDEEKNERENEIIALKSEVSGLMGNIENERERLSQACREKDLMKGELDCQVKEASRLKDRLIEMEGKERNLRSEILVLQSDYGRLKKEKNERDGDIEAFKKEKGLLGKRLVGLEKETDDLKLKIKVIVKEKNAIEMQNSEQKVKIDELEKEVNKLNEIVLALQKEEKVFCSEAMDEKLEMVLEIKALMDQEREKQKSIERLIEEKDEISHRLEKAVVVLDDKEGEIAKLLREKNDIEERKVCQDNEISGLHKEIGELRDVVFKLKASCRDQQDKSKQLVNELADYKSALDQATLERDNAWKDLDEQRKSGMDLRLKLSEMEKRFEEKVEELAKTRNERETLVDLRRKMESHIGLLAEEKELMQKNLLEAKRNADDLRAKMESIGFNYDRALSMLKNTAAMVCQSENDIDGQQELVVDEKKLQGETDQYAAEFQAIVNAFRNREKLVEDMKHRVELMQNSVEAQKKKSFWTVVSSATTIFAAASVAYIARIR
ncbi:hypothetical protein CICLE_v10000602mg [Citrus x clementina]|uniref:Uncharacterized protein n=1 Tax=Citrus clementina TaxID=85681 RepID=V4SFN8_CITCL|nr:hypothetical protein CICLE_v10000602mg [Citrus x clementina]